LIVLRDEIIEIVIRFQNHVTAAAAIAAARPALGNIFLALKGHTTFAAMAGPRVNFDFVDEHVPKNGAMGCLIPIKKARPLASPPKFAGLL